MRAALRDRMTGKRWSWLARRESRATRRRSRQLVQGEVGSRRGAWSGCGARLVCTWAWGRALWACRPSVGAKRHAADAEDVAAPAGVVWLLPLLLVVPALLVVTAAARLAAVLGPGALSASDVSCDGRSGAEFSHSSTTLSSSSIRTACKRSTRFLQKCRQSRPTMIAATTTIPTMAAEVTVVVLIVGAGVVERSSVGRYVQDR